MRVIRSRDQQNAPDKLNHRGDEPGTEDPVGRISPRELPDLSIEVEKPEDKNTENRVD